MEIPKNMMIKSYFDVYAEIIFHNRQHQDDLELRRIFKTVTWWKRVYMPVFGVIVIDTVNVYSEVVQQSELDEILDAFFTNIAREMIFNDIGRPESRKRQGLARHSPGSPVTSTSPHNSIALTPLKKN